MAFVKTALALAPFLLNARSRRSNRHLAGVFLSIGLMALAGVFTLTALSVWIGKLYGAEFGFLTVGVTFILLSLFTYLKSGKTEIETAGKQEGFQRDPLSSYLPDELKDDQRVQAALNRIQEYPIGSTAAAVSIGYVLSNQILGD